MKQPLATPLQWFLFAVQTASIVKDFQTGDFKSPHVVCQVGNIEPACLEDYDDDLEGIGSLAEEYVKWMYGQCERPAWIRFYNGQFS